MHETRSLSYDAFFVDGFLRTSLMPRIALTFCALRLAIYRPYLRRGFSSKIFPETVLMIDRFYDSLKKFVKITDFFGNENNIYFYVAYYYTKQLTVI